MLKITKNQGSIQVTADNSGFYPFDGTLTFPTNSLFTCAQNNTDMITFKSTSNGDVQFVGNYKDITISGRSYDTKQKFLTAFSNLANQGSVDAYTKAETDTRLDAKQDKLKAGDGITLTEDATDNTTVVKTAVSLTDNGNGAYTVGDSIKMGSNTVAIGRSATSQSANSIAVGKGATSGSGTSNVAIGILADSSGGSSIAIGNKTETSNIQAIAIGTLAGAYIPKSIAIGYNAKAVTDTPMVINAGGKTMIQSDSNGKLSILKGDGTDERIVIQDALSAGGSGGTVDAYTKAETDTKLEAKQDKLTAGTGITITKDETAGTSTIATAVSLTDNGNGAYQVGDSIKMGDGIAIGSGATSPSAKSIAIGKSANINSDDIESVAIGYKANAAESYSVAIGGNAIVSRWYGVSVGYQCASDDSSVAIGRSSYATGGNAVAIGRSSYATGGNAVAIGYEAVASSDSGNSIAIGLNASATESSSIAIGEYAETSADTPMVINAGGRTVLQSDATGKLSILKGDGTDTRMVIQDEIEALKNAGGGGTVDAYTKTETDNLLNAKQNTLTAGSGITIDENNVISSTGGSGGSTNPLVAVKGTGSATITDTVTDAVAIGSGTNVSKDYGVCVGYKGGTGVKSVAVGYNCYANGDYSVTIGSNSIADGIIGYSIAIGHRAKARGNYGLSIGYCAEADNTTPLVINAGGKSMIQGDENGKISLLKGDGTNERIVIQDEIEALKNAGGSGGGANPLVAVKGTDSATITDTVTDAVAIGSGAKVTEELSVAIGAANALSGHCVAIGGGANATKMSSVAIGDGACATAHMFDVAIGFHAATTDTKPLEINAGYKTVGGATTPLTVLQSDSTGKLSILKGDDSDERIVISDEITALKAEITTLKAEIAALKGGASTGDTTGA